MNEEILAIGLSFCFLEYLYGLYKYNAGFSELDRSLGLHYIHNSLTGLAYFVIGVSALLPQPDFLNTVLNSDAFTTLDEASKTFYDIVVATDGYRVGIFAVASRLTLTMILRSLTEPWLALVALCLAISTFLELQVAVLYVLCKIIEVLYPVLITVGVAFLASERLRGLSGGFIVSPIVLRYTLQYVGALDSVKTAAELEFPIKDIFGEVPTIINALQSHQNVFLQHGLIMIEATTVISIVVLFSYLISRGLSRAIGGIPHAIAVRI
ncbi:MAG: hypothetical protein DRJ32_03175 [Thermoprotei archaeon]|nr:MAG: hypothetical protein DRJ32_03175 [Thermoprotei archaeon]